MKCFPHLFLFLILATPGFAGSLVYMRVPKPLVEEHIKQSKSK